MSTPLLRPHVRSSAVRSALAGALLLTLAVSPGLLSAASIPTFVPIGAGYEADTLEQFAREAANVDTSGEVSILASRSRTASIPSRCRAASETPT